MKRIIVSLFAILLLTALGGCGAPREKAAAAPKTMRIELDVSTVEAIELYWAYRTYTLRREDSAALIDETVACLNGTYTACAAWVNDSAGSGNRITLFDADGNTLKTYYIFTDEEQTLSLWDSDMPEHLRFRKDSGGDELKKVVEEIRGAQA